MNELRNKIAFLRLIPEHLYIKLNFDEFYIPDDELNLLRQSLESELDCYIMCYQKHKSNKFLSTNLCELICAATLNKDQMMKLVSYESKFTEMILVAYAKPLKLSQK